MNTLRFAAASSLFLLAASSLYSVSAHAGEVYQCQGATSTIYQDQPCPGNPDQAPRFRTVSTESSAAANGQSAPANPAAPPAVDANQHRAMEIYNGLKQAEQDRNQVEQARQAEIAAAQARYKDNKQAADAEVRAIAERWNAQVKEVQQRQDNYAAQAHEVCPNSVEIGRDGKCR